MRLLIILISVILTPSVVRADDATIGYFPKMTECETLVYQGMGADTKQAKHVIRVLQGIVNREQAELFLDDGANDTFWFKYIDKPFRRVNKRITSGTNPALRSLFGEYHSKVDKLVVCDFRTASYTWNMGVMMACVENALPVTEEIKNALVEEFPEWQGEVVDIRNRWSSTKEAYEWAIKELLPKMNKRLVFSLGMRNDWQNGEWKAYDYAVATRSFTFFLDNHTAEGADLIRRILREGGYEQNATVMGYGMHGDDLNDVTNPEGFGYVVGDFIPNLSLYSSLPSQSFDRPVPTPVVAENDKVYVALHFSDGDNIFFDHNLGLDIYRNEKRGQVPVSMTLAPALSELAPFILRYYHENVTPNDELIGGPSGFQFIQESLYKTVDYGSWCEKNALWLNQAGMNTTASSLKWPVRPFLNNGFLKTGVNGTLAWSNGSYIPAYDWFGMPVVVTGGVTSNADEVINYLSGVQANGRPAFTGVYMVQAGFGSGAYEAAEKVKREMDTRYPGKYVFLKASDLLLTAKAWFDAKRAAFVQNAIPGIIEMEDFDLGGRGIGFDNAGNGTYSHDYRSDASEVNIRNGQTGHYVTSAASQWLSYTVDVQKAGTYELALSLTVPADGTVASVMMDGEYLATIDAKAQSSFREYKQLINIASAGKHTIYLFFYQAGVKADYLVFTNSQTDVTAIDHDQTFCIVAKHSGKVVAPISDSDGNGVNIVQKSAAHDDQAVAWRLSPTNDGYEALMSAASGKFMTCRAGKRMQLYDYDNTSQLQHWNISFVDTRHFRIIARGTGKCVEIAEASAEENALLQLADYTGADNQLFYLERIASDIQLPMTLTRQVSSHAYNLQGHQVTDSFRGVVIRNGRKYYMR